MKTILLTPKSSVKSSTTATTTSTTTMDGGDSSSYFPGCRKDANCNCQMCLASFNATLDLRPTTIRRESRTNNFAKSVSKTPISFNPSLMSTPKSGNNRLMVSPAIHSTARTRFKDEMNRKKRNFRFLSMLLRLIVGLSLIVGAEFGFSWMVSKGLQTKLSPEIVRNLAGKSKGFQDLNKRMEFLNMELQEYVGEKILNCSSVHSTWEIIQDGVLLNSHCTLYRSWAEEVRIWGWPLQTAGLLTTDFSSKSLTILTGRVTEWSNGEARSTIRRANASWKQGKWSFSVVHLDQNTWILEYKRNALIENEKLVSAAAEFVKFRMVREVQKMKRAFLSFSAFDNQLRDFTEDGLITPT